MAGDMKKKENTTPSIPISSGWVLKNIRKLFDLSSFKLNKTEDSVFKDNYQMLSVRQLDKAIDSLEKTNYPTKKRCWKSRPYLHFSRIIDTGWVNSCKAVQNNRRLKSMKALIPDSARSYTQNVISQIAMSKSTIDINCRRITN